MACSYFPEFTSDKLCIVLMLTPAVTTGHVMSMDELANVKGRGWEDIDVRGMTGSLFAQRTKAYSNHSINLWHHLRNLRGSLEAKVI